MECEILRDVECTGFNSITMCNVLRKIFVYGIVQGFKIKYERFTEHVG